MPSILVTRPQPIRVLSLTSFAVVIAWAASTGDANTFGTLAFPAIVGLQTVREWRWSLQVRDEGLYERQGVGPDREIPWEKVVRVIMPNAALWRLNPILEIDGAPNVQLTAAETADAAIRAVVRHGKPVEGDASSITLGRSLTLWVVVLTLATVLLVAELAGGR